MKKIIFFDWDDTLYFTSAHENLLTNPINIKIFNDYIENLEKLLTYAQSKGRVIILTNGSLNWVETCCSLHPQLKKILTNHTIQVISARDNYSKLYPKEYVKWKECTMKTILYDYSSNEELHVISIGDSNDERIAVWNTTGISTDYISPHYNDHSDIPTSYSNKNIKTCSLKLLKQPTFTLLFEQIKLLSSYCLDLLLDSKIECDYVIETNYSSLIKCCTINLDELWLRPVLNILPRIPKISDEEHVLGNKRKRPRIL